MPPQNDTRRADVTPARPAIVETSALEISDQQRSCKLFGAPSPTMDGDHAHTLRTSH